MNSLEITWNCSLSPMTFLNSLLIVLSRIIDWKALEVLYDFLLGLEMMMVDKNLKCDGQWPNSMYALAILMNFLRHVVFLMYLLRYFLLQMSYSLVVILELNGVSEV